VSPPDRQRRVERRMRARLQRGEVTDFHNGVEGHSRAGQCARSTGLGTLPAIVITRLLLGDAQPETPGRSAVLHIRGAYITGALVLRHATIRTPLVLENCVFDQPVDLSHAHAPTLSIQDTTLPVLTAHELQLDGDLNCDHLHAGTIDLFGARIGGQLWLTHAHVDAPTTEWAINAPNMVVAGGVYARGLTARGGINLYGTEVGSALELGNATITTDDRPAIRAGNLIVGTDVHLDDIKTRGSVDLFGARIGGQLWLNNARLMSSTGTSALDGPSMTVTGGVYARALSADGGINFWGTEVGVAIELDGATLTSAIGPALRGPRLSVRGDVTISDNAAIEGNIDLESSIIGGTLALDGIRLCAPEGSTVNLTAARLGNLRINAIEGPHVGVNLRRATVGSIEDDPSAWPQTLQLDGLSYDRLLPHLPARQRLAWLDRDPEAGHPQPYQQLAGYYRRAGQDRDARTVLLERQRKHRKQDRSVEQVWGYLQDITVGYGYRPARALGWLLVLISAVAIYAAARQPHPAAPSSPSFNAIAYAADVVFPILDLGQEKAFIPSGLGQPIAWLAALAGWILATAVIAAITRTITRE
jgi:hypothetical protein